MSVSLLSARLKEVFPHGLSGLIFDCDGVLIDSKDANIGYYNLLLAELGHEPVSEEQELYVQMSTAQQAVEYLFPEEELKLLPEIVRRLPYHEKALPLLKLEQHLVPLVHWLKEEGVRLGVHTNRGSGVWDVLHTFQLQTFFDPVMNVERVRPKPDPEGVLQTLEIWDLDPCRVGFVGDSQTDVEAAKGGGVPLLAYRNPELGAAVHVERFDWLHEALRGVLLPGSR